MPLIPLLRGEHVQEERAGSRKFIAVRLHLRDDFALPLKPPAAFGDKPFSFGKALPRALSVHTRTIGENLLSRFRRVRHNIALGSVAAHRANGM